MHILYSCSSYRLLRGLHLSVSPMCILGLVSCVYCPFIAQIMIVTLHNRAPQAGTDVKACMTAHLHRTHTCYAPRFCPHSQACGLSSLSAVIIHLKPPPLVHAAHLLPSLPRQPCILLKERRPELLFSGSFLHQVISCQGPVAMEKEMWASPKKQQHAANHVPIIQRETAAKRVLGNNSLYGL